MIHIVLDISLEFDSLGCSYGCSCPNYYTVVNLNGFTIFENSDRNFPQFQYCLYNVRFVGLISLCFVSFD